VSLANKKINKRKPQITLLVFFLKNMMPTFLGHVVEVEDEGIKDMLHVMLLIPLLCFPQQKQQTSSPVSCLPGCTRKIPHYEVITFSFCHALWQVIFLSAYNYVCLQLIICVNLSSLLLVGFIGYISYFK